MNIPYLPVILKGLPALGGSYDILYRPKGTRSQAKVIRAHTSRLNYPAHSFTQPAGTALPAQSGKMPVDLNAVSPELAFLEMAALLPIHNLILLGMTLCSYKPWENEAPLCTKKSLEQYLSKIERHHGIKKARRAVRYITDGSASIMESLIYMMLTLPHSLGGYGLYGAKCNSEIKLSPQAKALLGQNRCFVDFYYPHAGFAMEYDSNLYHSKDAEIIRDSIRSTALKRQGLSVLGFSTAQVYSERAFRDVAYVTAASIGKRIRIRAKKFYAMNAKLRALLPVTEETTNN